MSHITTHILDTSLGKPAAGVLVMLSVRDGDAWRELGQAQTDTDGRVRGFVPPSAAALSPGSYRLTFETAAYFRAASRSTFFERVTLDFRIDTGGEHFHVPLLLTPFGYTTYRGS
jgi:5-hydroxyisourate hydrolase